MRHIRPYVLFNSLHSAPGDRIANVKIPNRRDLCLLETLLLITASRIVNAKRIFEFGTFFGSTTFNLALNSPPEAEVFTFDLAAADVPQLEQLSPDATLTREHLEKSAMDFEDTPVSRKIARLTGNSKSFDFRPWKNSIDFVFIDGGHDYETVEADTENAFLMTSKNSPACIFWHDYGHRDYSGNTYFLDQLSNKFELFHVEDTMLCGWFSEDGI